MLFPGFETHLIKTSGADIRCVVGGSGPALLLLHGHPQTLAMWHACAGELIEHFTVVAADLRGYGRSSKPPSDADHAAYSKRAMAKDMTEVMSALGYERFFVAGHDRGGRVAHRLALDHAARVEKVAVLDIAPTREMYRRADRDFATGYWHWFFLIQPALLPETLINADPDFFWKQKCGSGVAGLSAFDEEALEEYLVCYRDPETVRAICEDYRASATIDIAHDDADEGLKIACPLLVLWGGRGKVGQWYDPALIWQERADDVRGLSIDCGHYMPEEAPEAVSAAFIEFFRDR